MKKLGLATCRRRTDGGRRTKENNPGRTTNIRKKKSSCKGLKVFKLGSIVFQLLSFYEPKELSVLHTER